LVCSKYTVVNPVSTLCQNVISIIDRLSEFQP
jgi:hypothetical protein